MRRRTYLGFAGTALGTGLAGCTDTQDAEGTVQDRQTATPTDTSAGGDPTDTATETDTETDTKTETESPTPAGEPEIVLGDGALSKQEGSYSTDAWVDVTVTNEGQGASGQITLTAQWYDGNGDYIGDAIELLPTLRAGETWAARVYAYSDQEDIEGFELDGEFETDPPVAPEGLDLTESDLTVEDEEVTVTGRVANNTGEDVDYAEANARLITADGTILSGEFTNESDVPAGETWRFEVTWFTFKRTDEIDAHDVTLNGQIY